MSKVRNSWVLLLSATFDAGQYSNLLTNSDIEARIVEYRNALSYWANFEHADIAGICFCENSGADLTDFARMLPKTSTHPIEYLSFCGNERPTGMHYGYSELGLIDHAIEQSQLIEKYGRFIKVSGRLIFPTLSRLLQNLRPDTHFLADCHRYLKDETLPVRMRTQLFFSTAEFYRNVFFQTRKAMSADMNFIEEFMMQTVWPLREDSRILLRFPIECQPRGYSASFGNHYHSGIAYVKSQIRGSMRKIAPKIWL